MTDLYRKQIAKHLNTHGRIPGDELAATLGMTLEKFWPLINHPWFEITAQGWELSERGRREALEESERP